MTPKRQKVEAYVLKYFKKMDPNGDVKRYKEMFAKMDDKQFHDWMVAFRDKKAKLTFFTPNLKVVLNIADLRDTAKELGIKLFERIVMTDKVTGLRYLTNQEYLIVRLPVRRTRQFLMHKLSVPESDKRLDALTGQVTKPDKASSISFVEAQFLHGRGLDKTILEFMKIRGGDIHAYAQFKQQLEETGTGSMDSLDDNTVARSAVTLSTILKGMLLDNNFV